MSFRIFYLDDEPELLELFQDMFSEPGIDISVFSEVSAALKAIEKQPPDLLFLDFRLAGITGDEIALQLDPGLPKALITGDHQVKTKASFVAYFSKPYRVGEIEAFIKKCIQSTT
jgi:DNA-binding NtrC family response regulator